MAYKSIIVMVAQRDLRIVSDGVVGSKVELPRNSRGEEGGKNKSTTQESSPKHGCSVGKMRGKQITVFMETHFRVHGYKRCSGVRLLSPPDVLMCKP